MRKELHLPQPLKMQLVAVSEFVFQISIHLVQVFAPAGKSSSFLSTYTTVFGSCSAKTLLPKTFGKIILCCSWMG
eukprot:jgi/Botrbrau1/3709/Bobra.0008s0034.1